MPDSLFSAVSAAAAIFSIGFGWIKWRDSELRRADVLAWSCEAISTLESLLLVCNLPDVQLNSKIKEEKLTNIIFNTAILVEQGRLFFKNQVINDHGADKESAYRGYRPRILDPLVIAHQIARAWLGADSETCMRMRLIAEDCLKKFVSLAQKEVGRSRTAAADTRQGGDGSSLDRLLGRVDKSKLKKPLMNQSR